MGDYNGKDFSAEFAKPIAYTKQIMDKLSLTRNLEKDGSMILEDFEVTAWFEMLSDVVLFLEEMNEELYPGESNQVLKVA